MAIVQRALRGPVRLRWLAALVVLVACAKAAKTQVVKPRAYALSHDECERGVGRACAEAAQAILAKHEGAPSSAEVARRLLLRGCDELSNPDACLELAWGVRSRTFDADERPAEVLAYAEKACTLSQGSSCGLFGALLFFHGTGGDRDRGRGVLQDSCEKGSLASCAELHLLLAKNELDARGARDASYYADKLCPHGFADLCSCAPQLESVRSTAPPATRTVSRARPWDQLELIKGETEVHLPQSVVRELAARRIRNVFTAVKICVSQVGDVSCVELYKRTGFDGVEARLLSVMRDWKFKPYLLDGKPTPVCSIKIFNNVID